MISRDAVIAAAQTVKADADARSRISVDTIDIRAYDAISDAFALFIDMLRESV